MTKKDNKNLTTWIVGAVSVVVLIVVVAVALIMSNSTKLDESFFVSDDTKYVLALDATDGFVNIDTNNYMPVKMYLAYFYSGDEVTGLKMYYQYEDTDTAKKAADYVKEQKEEQEDEEIEKVEVDGVYVIVSAGKSAYEGLTAEEAKQQVEFMQMLQNMNFSDYSDEDSEEEVVVEDEE